MMCSSRVEEGQSPACVAVCPTQALIFGERQTLLEKARNRFIFFFNRDRFDNRPVFIRKFSILTTCGISRSYKVYRLR